MPNTDFDVVKITKGEFTPSGGTKMDLGCTGALSGTTALMTKTKMCEGVPQKEISIPQYMELVFRGHLYVEAYRELFGLKADATILTKFKYGSASRNKAGAFAWVLENFEGDETKSITFPNAVVTSGYAFAYENGKEEVAEVELNIKAMVDANGDFYTEQIAAVV